MTPNMLPPEEYDERIWEIADVEEILRIWAIRLNTDDWDTWGGRRGKNCYWYRPPQHGKWILMAWDMELTYGSTNAFMPPTIGADSDPRYGLPFSEATNFVNRPRIKRLYYGIMHEMINRQFTSDFLAPYMAKLDEATVQQTAIGKPRGFIDGRRNLLECAIRGGTQDSVPFSVTTGDGGPISSPTPRVLIEGRAPIEIFSIAVAVNGEAVEATPRFSNDSIYGWSVELTLPEGSHDVQFVGFDSEQGSLAETATSVTVSDAPFFVRGDVDQSGGIEVTDAIQTLLFLFAGRSLPCNDAADTNDDGDVNQSDAVVSMQFLFQGGDAPPAPYPSPGVDPNEDDVSCESGLPLP